MSSPTVAPGPARTRISLLRVAVLLLCTALIGWFGMQAISSAVTPVAAPGPTYFSGYVDVTNTPAYPFETPPGPAQSNVTLAFVVSGPDDDCAPMWGGAYTLDTASSDLDLDRRISQLRLVGGQARVSFGGAGRHRAGLDVHRPGGAGRRVPGGRRPVRAHEHRPRPRGHLPGRRGSRGASGRRDQGRPGRREQRRTPPGRLADPSGGPDRAHDRGRSGAGGDAVRRRGRGRRERDDHGLRQRRVARPADVRPGHRGIHRAARPGAGGLRAGRPLPRRR